ncbi:WW domain-binding protein 4 [Zerene cesonia]|uniref:WW domain-binding protein 4 n=1 Tax=Zerene cesonia TaxID=33412 RepID=UPI0018E57AA4|nr:WW domain-binding protein 4 [Zerene cesonia]
MTEYWKSQARKYCEFCKCWLADNKVSISFHENGKRHKESVKKHISLISKKSAKEFKVKEKQDDDIKKMEEAAMSAYLKDVQNNADLTSKNINEMLGQSGNSSQDIVVTASGLTAEPIWHEVKGADGNSYYWNTQTNETAWDAPDNYLSITQQEEKKLKESKKEKKLLKQKQKEAIVEVKAHIARESMKELAVKKEKPPPVSVPLYGPEPRSSKPYGKWETIVHEPVEKIDLQLPKKEVFVPPVVVQPEIVRFKEKRVESLGEGPVEFKKRKINNAKRNMRQKIDDE